MVEDHWSVCMWGGVGWTNRFNVPGPFQDKRPRPVKKKKRERLGPRRDAFPFTARTRTDLQDLWCVPGGESRIWDGDEIGWAGASDVAACVLAGDSQQRREWAGGRRALGEVWRSVELNRVGVRPRFIHGRGRHSIPGASLPLAGFGSRPRGDSIARYLAPSCQPAQALPLAICRVGTPDMPASLGGRYWGTYWWSLASFRSSQEHKSRPPRLGIRGVLPSLCPVLVMSLRNGRWLRLRNGK